MYPNLRAEIARKGMTAASLGEAVGKTASQMSLILSGKAPISVELAKKIQTVLEVEMPLDELFEVKQ